MPSSVLDAIKLGLWDFEPEKVPAGEFDATRALPGTNEKLAVLSERLRQGLPLWHPCDVRSFEDQQGANALQESAEEALEKLAAFAQLNQKRAPKPR